MARLPKRRHLDLALALGMAFLLGAGVGHSRADVMTAPLYPYELAFLEAPVIVQGDVVSYEPTLGAGMRVDTVVRGEAQLGRAYQLHGSANYSFLAAQPSAVTAFISKQDANTLTLWQGPTSGGLIWSEPGLLELIARAHATPSAALQAGDPREQLAGSYYLATLGTASSVEPSASELNTMMNSIAWGLEHDSPNTNQAAVDALSALGYPLEALGINYHPIYKLEFKRAAASQLRTWWALQR